MVDANLATSWSIKGVEDMNQDGVPDLVWHQSTTGRAYVWALNASGTRTNGWDVSATYPATAWKMAGVADMSRARFTLFNVVGGAIWVLGLVTAGYLFGNLPWVQANLSKIIWALILVPGLIALYGAWKAGRADRQAA